MSCAIVLQQQKQWRKLLPMRPWVSPPMWSLRGIPVTSQWKEYGRTVFGLGNAPSGTTWTRTGTCTQAYVPRIGISDICSVVTWCWGSSVNASWGDFWLKSTRHRYIYIYMSSYCVSLTWDSSVRDIPDTASRGPSRGVQTQNETGHEVASCSFAFTERGSNTEVNHIHDRQTHTRTFEGIKYWWYVRCVHYVAHDGITLKMFTTQCSASSLFSYWGTVLFQASTISLASKVSVL